MTANTSYPHGAQWVRADFHMHTREDKEFAYVNESEQDGDPYEHLYVEALKEQSISVGAITNHNKFVRDEFVKLRKKAKKSDILLLPGVELSVSDGGKGVHVLIIFSDEWIADGDDHINPFLNTMFCGQSPKDYEDENGRCDQSILQVVEALDKCKKDYFLIFAHVERNNGLWKEFSGGRLQDFQKDSYKRVREKTLGFQLVETDDTEAAGRAGEIGRKQAKAHLGGWYPAELEGCDCKSIDQIGKQQANKRNSYIKIGDRSYAAVKFALSDPDARVRHEQATVMQHSHIKSVRISGGGSIRGAELAFSPEFNSLIGIRGSGKSSIIEVIRYGLNLRLDEKTLDRPYKDGSVQHTLGSGGSVEIVVQDRHQQEFTVRRVYGEVVEVYKDGELQPGVSVCNTILHKPIYFGQKDLSSMADGFENQLLEKMLGEELMEAREESERQKERVQEAIKNLQKITEMDEQLRAEKQKLQDAEFQLKIYKDLGIAEKMAQQANYEKDQTKIEASMRGVVRFREELRSVVNEYEDELKNHLDYESKENATFFTSYNALYKEAVGIIETITKALDKLNADYAKLNEKHGEFKEVKVANKEAFAKVRSKLEEEVREKGNQSIRIDDFPSLMKSVDTSKKYIDALGKNLLKKDGLEKALLSELSALSNLWHKEHEVIHERLTSINESQDALKITPEYKGDTDAYLEFFKSMYRGSRIHGSTLESMVEEFSDFINIYRNWDKALELAGGSQDKFSRYFHENLAELLTYQVPNKIRIEYKGKGLSEHSLGQRASALILFVLSQKEHDIIIIDQPEDDLDNQTIYQDVILLLRKMKCDTQFIFATHNANFPVLGDAEQIHACRYRGEQIMTKTGSIDNPSIQHEVVDIMEGGQDAFNKRKNIYDLWN